MDETFKKLLCVYNFYKTFMWIKLDFRFTSRKAWRQKHHLLPFWLLKRTKMLFERYLVTLVTFPKMKLTAASCSIGQLVQLLKPSFLNWKCEILSRNSTADLDILAYPCSHLGDTKTCNTVNCRSHYKLWKLPQTKHTRPWITVCWNDKTVEVKQCIIR